MNDTEIIVVIGGALLGYWLVSKVLGSKSGEVENRSRSTDDRENQNETAGGSSNFFENGNIAASWFQILEVAECASKDEIVRAYKKKISQYHPDKVATLGAELRGLAEAKSQQINAAFDYAMTLRE